MGSCVATLRGGIKKRQQESQRLKSKKEDSINLLEETVQAHSFAIYIIDNKGDIEDFYDVEDTKIGEGSFGRVCRCTNKSTGAERAVKMLRKVRRKSQLIMFKNELSTLKMLDHPHIVKLYEHFEDRRYMYIVMEMCHGGELFDRLLEVGNFSENQAAVIMQQIFRGIYYLHTMKVVHRDLKIENFMFAGEGPVEANMIKIIDFGFARSFTEGQFMKTKVGAPYFVSPQILAGKYTEATDMWTCGTIMYILLCGYPPFFGDSDAEILSRVRAGNFSFNDADWRHVSELAKDLIRGLLRMSEIERVNAKQALFDQWIIQTAPVLRAPLKQKYFENMRRYVGFNKFKQAVLQIIVSQLEPEIAKPLIDTFMWLDSSGEGQIDADEIEAGMKRAGWTEVEIPEDLHEMVAGLDADGSGEVGLGEFAASILDLQIYAREETCWAVFRIFDQDGDGLIGNTDIHFILNNGQPDGQEVVSGHECRELIKEVDEDGDKRISFSEFLDMMKGTTSKKKKKDKGTNKGAIPTDIQEEIDVEINDDAANLISQEQEGQIEVIQDVLAAEDIVDDLANQSPENDANGTNRPEDIIEGTDMNIEYLDSGDPGVEIPEAVDDPEHAYPEGEEMNVEHVENAENSKEDDSGEGAEASETGRERLLS